MASHQSTTAKATPMATSTAAKSRQRETVATKPISKLAQPHDIVLSPTTQNAAGIHAWGEFSGQLDLGELITGLRQQVREIQGGNMGRVEAMLYGQAMTLQTIFTNLARRAVKQEYLKQFQTYTTLAFKAQAQCRATLEALAEIKNPRPVSFVKQANIANGPQQVNNGTTNESVPVSAGAHAHAEQNTNVKSELLEHQHGNHLDTRAQSQAGRPNSHMEAVEQRQRAAHG
jgi:hypothetical protein